MNETLHSFLKMSHIIGIVLGVGSAIIADFYSIYLQRRPLTSYDLMLLKNIEKLIFAGLALLWVSGVGFFVEYQFFSPEKLGNPKILAKLSVVIILTLNGLLFHMFFHGHAFREGVVMIALPARTYFSLMSFAVVSGVSWIAAIVFGAVAQLNFAFSYLEIIGAYLVALVLALTVSTGIAIAVRRLQT